MIQQIKDLVKYALAILGYYGAYEVAGNQTATASVLWAIKATGGDIEIATVANVGSDLTLLISDGDVHFGNYKSVNVSETSVGTALIYPLDTNITIV